MLHPAGVHVAVDADDHDVEMRLDLDAGRTAVTGRARRHVIGVNEETHRKDRHRAGSPRRRARETGTPAPGSSATLARAGHIHRVGVGAGRTERMWFRPPWRSRSSA